MWLRGEEREKLLCVGKRRLQCFVLPKAAAVVKRLVARPDCLLPRLLHETRRAMHSPKKEISYP